MCGIVGYVGYQEAKDILTEGLRRLEYRGYDSAGMAFVQNATFDIVRAEGKLVELVKKLKDTPHLATVGIGHTRWATHGRPNEINAHPHHSQDVAVVHNGIIENYLLLRQELKDKGHHLVSETDSEVICHLLQDYLNQNYTFFEAFSQTIKRLQGAFSLVILHRQDPDKIYVARQGSPLVIGLTDDEGFVASDVAALLSHTNQIIFLEDEEMGFVEKGQASFFKFNQAPVTKKIKTIHWSAAQAEKGGYKHFMLKEIMEQPRVFGDTLLGRVDRNTATLDLQEANLEVQRLVSDPRGRIQIIACGTSYHAGLIGAYWIERLAKIPVSVDLASEFRYRHALVDEHTLVVAISQSGETADTMASVKESLGKKSRVLAICNVLESSIPRSAHATIYTHAGPEIGVASTKAFLTQLAVLYMLALKLAQEKQTLPQQEFAQKIQELTEVPKLMQDFLEKSAVIKNIAEKICRKSDCYFLGRGMQFPIALEGALKLKEISYIHAEGYAGGEMKHGPIALIEEGVPVVALLPQDCLYEKMLSNIQELAARGAEIYPVISQGNTELKKYYPHALEIPATSGDMAPFFSILPLQLLAYEVADLKGTDVDQPRNLAKSVTVE